MDLKKITWDNVLKNVRGTKYITNVDLDDIIDDMILEVEKVENVEIDFIKITREKICDFLRKFKDKNTVLIKEIDSIDFPHLTTIYKDEDDDGEMKIGYIIFRVYLDSDNNFSSAELYLERTFFRFYICEIRSYPTLFKIGIEFSHLNTNKK